MLRLTVPLQKLFEWFRRPQLWELMIGSFIMTICPQHASHLAEFFCETSNHPDESAPLQPRFAALWLLTVPQTKITFEREEISDDLWNSGKYNMADCDWEKCVRSQGAYLEGDWGAIVLCTIFLVFCIFFNTHPYFSHYMAGYLLDISHTNTEWYHLHIKSKGKKKQ